MTFSGFMLGPLLPYSSQNRDYILNSKNDVDTTGILARVPVNSLDSHPLPTLIISCTKDIEDSAHVLEALHMGK